MSDDPLEDADVGETADLHDSELRLKGLPEQFSGGDRELSNVSVEAEIVTVRDGMVDIQLRWDAQATKCIPEDWDRRVAPVTDAERRQAWLRRWLYRLGRAIPCVITAGVAIGVTTSLSQSLYPLTVNGETATAPDPVATATTLSVIVLIATVIVYILSGGLPRRVGGAR